MCLFYYISKVLITYPGRSVWTLAALNDSLLTHWGRVMHICVSKLTSIVSDNGLSPGWRQAIIWTNAGILLIGPLGTNSSEILIGIRTFWFKKMSSGKWRPFCFGLNVSTSNDHHIYREWEAKDFIRLWIVTLKWKCQHFDEIFISGCTGSCQCPVQPAIKISSKQQFHFNKTVKSNPW